MTGYRDFTAHGFSWAYKETDDEGGAFVYTRTIPARKEQVDEKTWKLFDTAYEVMRLFTEDLTVDNFEMMARMGLTRVGKHP